MFPRKPKPENGPEPSGTPIPGQSIFAPGFNPPPARVDFGLGQIHYSSPDPEPYFPAAEPASPFPDYVPEPQPLAWEAAISADTPQAALPIAESPLEPVTWQAPEMPEQPTPYQSDRPMPEYLQDTGYQPAPEWRNETPAVPTETTATPPVFDPDLPPELLWEHMTPTVYPASETTAGLSSGLGFEETDVDAASAPNIPSSSFELPIDFPSQGYTDNAPFPEEPILSEGSQPDAAFWQNLAAPDSTPGEQMPTDPLTAGQFLDSVNGQLYPDDPFSMDTGNLAAGEQAFEEAAQILFPETVHAPVEWNDPFAPPLTQEAAVPFLPQLDLGPSHSDSPDFPQKPSSMAEEVFWTPTSDTGTDLFSPTEPFEASLAFPDMGPVPTEDHALSPFPFEADRDESFYASTFALDDNGQIIPDYGLDSSSPTSAGSLEFAGENDADFWKAQAQEESMPEPDETVYAPTAFWPGIFEADTADSPDSGLSAFEPADFEPVLPDNAESDIPIYAPMEPVQPPVQEMSQELIAHPEPVAFEDDALLMSPGPAESIPAVLSMDNLEIVGVCPLYADKRLLLVQSNETYALIGQAGEADPQISVLKLFDHNPVAYQTTFTAVQEGQTGTQGMFVTQVGTWHAIVSTFQDKITIHTELG